ncbi:bacteriorhodopsin [Natrinema caseinilyticum]|uniref:bacteriorhodopsin n=1 Tax=Natrinema caseinilyticum TaxID=2961570 RepID=UPI0020C1F26B|nr:bacteriorhodopsin [Natrinema caseinilyticum]
MIPPETLYRIMFYAMAVAAGFFLVWISRLPQEKRRYYLIIPIICGITSLAYFSMSTQQFFVTNPTGQPVQVGRYIEYFTVGPMMVTITCMVAGASRRQLIATNAVMVSWTSATVAGYFLTEPAVYAANIANFALLGLLAYILVWPITRQSGKQGGERVLLYGKLRNLLLILFGGYLVLGLLSRQGFGLLDAFSGIFLGIYLDALTRIGFGVLVFRATDATDQLIAEIGSDDAGDGGVTLEKGDPAD